MKKILVIASVVMLWMSGAWALGTVAGTDINNSATLSYSAGGVAQDDVTSTTDTFVVDKKIDLVLTDAESDQIGGAFGQTGVETHYNFKNEGNADQNFTFSADNLSDNEEADYDEDKDNNAVSNLVISCTYTKPDNSSATETGASITIEVKLDTDANCTVKADMPDAQHAADGDIMNIYLEAKAVKGDGSDETNTTTSDDQHAVDVVLADGASGTGLGGNGGGKGDTAEDGKDIARHGYIIKTPVLDATKSSCVYSDPIHGQSDHAKRIPGAVILYVVDINNTGSLDASGITFKDTLQNDLDGSTLTSGKDLTAADKVTVDVNASSCSCSDGALSSSGSDSDDQDNEDQKIEIQNISVGKAKHTCLSFTVEIK